MTHQQALSDLLARFTADRDALIRSVEACQEQVSDLVARASTASAAPPAPSPAAPTVDEDVWRSLEELRASIPPLADAVASLAPIPGMVDAIRAVSSEAEERSERALHAADESATSARQTAGDVRALREAADETRGAIDELRGQMGRLEERIEAHRAAPSDADPRLVQALETAERSRADAQRAAAEVLALRAALEELRGVIATSEPDKAPAPDDPGSSGSTDLGAVHDTLEELRGRQAQLEETMNERLAERLDAAGNAGNGELAALRERVDSLTSSVTTTAERVDSLAVSTSTTAEHVATIGTIRSELATLREALARFDAVPGALQTQLHADLEGLRTALEGHLEGRILAAVQTGTADVETKLRGEIVEQARWAVDTAALTDGLAELRRAISDLRAQLGLTQRSLEERLDARIRVATGRWGEEADGLREHLDDLASRLDRHAEAHERSALVPTVTRLGHSLLNAPGRARGILRVARANLTPALEEIPTVVGRALGLRATRPLRLVTVADTRRALDAIPGALLSTWESIPSPWGAVEAIAPKLAWPGPDLSSTAWLEPLASVPARLLARVRPGGNGS